MKKIITAIDNPKLNEELKKEKNFKIIGKDIQYKEAILELLEENNNIDMIILSEKIPGEIKLEKLIKAIKLINEKIKIIFILEKENIELENILVKNNIIDIYYNSKINLKELIKIINKKEINMEEEIIKLKKIIEEKDLKYNEIEHKKEEKIKNYKINIKNKSIKRVKEQIGTKVKIILNRIKKVEKTSNMSTKIITFSGNDKSGKTTLSLIISQYLSEKNYKVLLIDGDFEKNDLSIILKKNKRKNHYYKNNKKQYRNKFNKKRINEQIKKINIKNRNNNQFKKLIYKKNKIYHEPIKQIINLFTQKINRNFYFFNGFHDLLKNKKMQKEKIIEEIIFFYLKTIKNNYNFIIVDLSKNNFNLVNKIIIKNSDINFILMEANVLGINEIKRILDTYLRRWKVNKNSLHIVSNKRNFNSINKSLIYHSIFPKKKIYEIKENKIYNLVINDYFRNRFLLKNKKLRKEINKIIYHIIMK